MYVYFMLLSRILILLVAVMCHLQGQVAANLTVVECLDICEGNGVVENVKK
jgi:hypothetical protein